jgi:hypothetical protein
MPVLRNHKVQVDENMDAGTLLVQVAGNGLHITEESTPGLAAVVVRIKELHPCLANTSCTTEPFVANGSGQEPTDTSHIIGLQETVRENCHIPLLPYI